MRALEDKKHLSPADSVNDGLLVRSIAWLDTHYLIHLPVGIEPFKEGSRRLDRLKDITFIEDHVRQIASRLTKDIKLLRDLQDSFEKIGEWSLELAKRISRYQKSDRAHDAVRDSKNLFWIDGDTQDHNREVYQISHRRRWLDTLGPTFDNTALFLTNAAYQLNDASLICQNILVELDYEAKAARYRSNESVGIGQQFQELIEGMEDLEEQLKILKEEELRFRDRAFK